MAQAFGTRGRAVRLRVSWWRIMPEKASVSVVIVNWNGAAHLRICLPSLLAQSYKAREIIVVDNGSSDDSEEVVKAFQVKWLPLKENIGLAPALNRGAAMATGDFLLFVNNDMRFDTEFVAALVNSLVQDKNIFATDGMQYSWEGNRPGHAATRLTNARRNQGRAAELVPGLYFFLANELESTPVFMASAACMLARKSLFDKLGGFDARLPLGYEDAEICWRAWIHGWKTVYVPGAICWHRVGGSGRSLEGARYNFRGILKGRVLLATKLLPLRYAVRTWFVSAAALLKDLALLRWPFAMDRMAILLGYGRLIPQLLREKDALFREAGLTPEEQLERMLLLTRKEELPDREISSNIHGDKK
jgi:GT2 family glycosyltransferase